MRTLQKRKQMLHLSTVTPLHRIIAHVTSGRTISRSETVWGPFEQIGFKLGQRRVNRANRLIWSQKKATTYLRYRADEYQSLKDSNPQLERDGINALLSENWVNCDKERKEKLEKDYAEEME